MLLNLMNILFALVFTVVAAGTVSDELDPDWELFKARFDKKYGSPLEEARRKQIFMQNKEEISQHNEDYLRGLNTYSMRITRFSDLLPREFEELHPPTENHDYGFPQLFRVGSSKELSDRDLPKTVDWRLKGAVTPVKDQGVCGSCWAFSTTGGLEGQLFLKTGNLVSLSEQNLVDCSHKFNKGCVRGVLTGAFDYVKEHGLDTEQSYPYTAKEGICRYNESNVALRSLEGYRRLPPGDESQLMAAVANAGPIPVCIDARPSFRHYNHGVYIENNCSTSVTNHCVLVVGYGTTDEGQDYWIVKNSWGSKYFGEGGYIRMARNKRNMCAIATWAYIPYV